MAIFMSMSSWTYLNGTE